MPQYEVSVPGKGTFSVSSPTELTDQQVWLAVQRQLELPEPPAPPPPPEGGFFPSVKRGFLQTQMLVGDVLPAMFGKAIGAEEYAKKQWEEAAETQKRIEREVPAAVPSYKDISSFGDAWVYAKEAVGESLASIIPSLLTGGAAGLLARPAVAAANAAAREAAEKTLMSAALSMGPPTQIALESAKKAAVQAGIDAAKRTAFRYEVAGGLAGSALQNIPEVYQNIKEETGKEDIPAALIAGGFNAALDTVLPVQLLKKIRGQGLSEKEIMGAWFKRGAAGLGKGFLTEGATEAAQEASSILAENFVAENSDVFNAKNLERVINAGLKGGLGGGVITAATDIATGKAPPPEQTDRQRIEQLQREIRGDIQTARSEKALEEAENAKKAAEDAEAARKEAERAPTVPELITMAQGQNAYSALEAEKQRLLGQEKKTKEVKEAIEVIKELQSRLVIEDVTRRAPSVPAEMDDKTIRSLGFVKSENPESVYQQLLGKSTRDPDVTAFLKNYAETKAKPQTKDRINTFLGRVERAQIPLTAEEIAEGERRAREAVTEPSGAGAPVVGEPGAGAPAAGVGVTQPSGVGPPVAPVGEPPVGEGAAPAPVAPPPASPPAPPVEAPAPPVEPPAPPAAPPVVAAPAAPPVAPAPAAPPVEAPAAQITFPPVTAITNFRVGPGGVITPRVIAQDRPLYRETNREGLEDILRYEQQADYKPMFVTDDKTLALGQGENKGVLVTFRPNSLSGKENAKPGTGVIGGREYQTDLIAPRSVMSVEMSAKDFGKLRPLVKRALTQFTRNELPDGRLQFVRKGLEEQVPAAPPAAPTPAAAPAPTAAPTIITAEQLIGFGVKKTQPMIRRIAGKNMDVPADRANVLTELNKYINNKDNSPESRENLAKFRDQFEEVGKTVTVAPTKAKKAPKTVMESALLARINAVGGLDLSLLSEFSERKETGIIGKDDRPLVRWINPMIPGFGKLFRSGGMQDYGEIARVLEEAGYMEPGSVQKDPTEAGERAKKMILSALRKEDAGQTISEIEEEARKRQEELAKMDQEEFDAENRAEFEAERQAIASAEGLTPADLDVLEDNIPFLTDAVGQTPERLAADMRAMGFTEEEISDAVTEFSRKAVAAQAPEARAEEAPQAPAAPKAAEELELEAPTAEELAARQKREEDAREAERAEQKRLEQKGRADAERGEFVLTGSDRPADVAAAAGQMDIFTEPSPATDAALSKPDSPKKGDEVSGAIVADALDNANLTPEETQRLESAFNAKAGSKPFLDRLVQEVQKYITKGAQSVAKNLRDSIGKIVKAVLGIAVVFNVSTAFPVKQIYAQPQVPAIDVTASKQAALGKLNLNGRSLSPNALRVANWIANTGNNNATNLIMDPASGLMYVMKGAKIVADAPALFGKAGIGEIDDRIRTMTVSRMTDADKITPAGKFPIKLEKDASYGTTITFMELEAGSYAIHRVYLGDPKERRAERLASSSPADNNVSYGCINVSNEFYDNVLSKLDLSGEAFAYLLPSDPKKLEKVLPTVPRYSLAEAVKTPSVTLPKETQAKIEELSGLLQKMLGKMGLKNVALNLAQDLERNGEYANRLITLALDATSPVRDLRHESLHAMKELGFFSDAQWATLTKMARDKWIDKYLKSRESVYNGQAMSRYDAYMRLYNGNEDLIIEEAIADAFGDFDATKAPPGFLQTMLFRMREFFRNIREAMGAANIDSAEDIFRRVEKGELKETAPAKVGAKSSLREPEKRGSWYVDATPQQQETLDRWEDDRTNGTPSNWQDLDIRPARENIYDSASGFFYDYEKAKGLFEIPIADIGPLTGYDSAKDKARIQNLAEQIKENREIEPVFVAVDPNGEAYLMEGQHRSRALELLGYKSVPARVIVSMDHEEQPSAKASLRAPETEAFKRWFGDSKVVDENGQPLVVYHGSPVSDITEFRSGRTAYGIFFSDSKYSAAYYNPTADVRNVKAGDLYEVYLKADKVADLRRPSVLQQILEEAGRGDEFDDIADAISRGDLYAYDLKGRVQDEIVRTAESMGFDAVILPDATSGEIANSYIVFRPEQIKSATGNIGTYDVTKPDIRYSLREVPLSTRGLMEVQPIVAMQELGLKTDAVRKPGGIELFNDVRSIALALNQETIRNHGQIAKTDTSLTSEKELARAMVDEIGYQLRATADTGTGKGWYSDNYPKAVKKLGKLFPELETNPYARTVFSALVAITSNGEKVSLNVKNAIKLYEDIRMGKDPSNIGSRRKTTLDNNIAVVLRLMQQYGPADMRNELLREITVRDMNAILRSRGEEPDTSYPANTRVPAAALYFGPKLGAFFSNLEGAEGYLTMDMWWTRTVNRMRGQLMSRATEASIKKFANMMGKPDATRDEVVAATIPFRNKYEEFGWHTELEELVGSKEPAKNKDKPAWTAKAKRKTGPAYQALLFEHRLEKMANTIYKNEYEMLEEAPFTGKDREFMLRTARRAQSLLKAEGINLSLADIQAALWYYEKRLYQHLSGRKADDIGYDEAITQLARESTGPARPSVVFAGQPVPGAGPAGTGAAAIGVGGKPAKPSLRDVEGMPTIGPKMDGTFLRRMENIRQQIGDAYISGEIDFEEFHKRYAATNEEYVNALFVQKKIDEAKPAAGLEEVFPGFVFIPEGTKVLATSGLSYPEPTEATVVGAQDIRIGAKAYKLPVVDFGDGRQRRLAYGDVKEVFAPRPVKPSLRDVPAASGMAYHAGNLGYGSDTTLGKMTGGRGTGHFGTGVYFVGSEDKTKSLAKTYDRPIQKVSLEGFKLARPGSVGAQQLHDGLKIVNNLVGNEPNTEDESKKIDDAAFKIWVSGVSRGASQEDIQKIIRQALAETRPLYDDLYATSTYVDSASTRVMKSLGYEGIDVRGLKDFDNTSFGTVVYTKKFEERPQVKPSLRDVPRANLRDQLNITTLQRIEQTTVAREEKGFVQRITEAISPKNFGFFRQQALNRYEGLSRADRMKIEQMGGVDLLADAGAESAALLSDMGAGVTASALGVHDRKGGAPVYNHYFVVEVNNRALAKRYTSKAQAQAAASAVNGVVRERGYVTVSNFNDSVKGPVLIFAPLMEKYKNPMIFRAFQFYSAAKRGARFMYTLDAKGNVIEKLFTADDINIELPRLEAQFPEFKTVHAEWIKYNDKLVDYMRDTGVISEQNAQTFKMHGDYFPFYRQIDGQDDALGPRIFQSISAVKPPKKLKGSELALGDFLENIVRNTQSAVQAGVKNVAARRAAQVGMDVGIVSEIPIGVTPEAANSFYVLENGLKKYYDTRDQLFIESIKSLNLPDMPFIGMLAGPANLLRNLVTKDPGFILANLMRDSMSAWATSGVKMTPMVDTMRNFAGALVNQSPEYKALLNAGVIGGYEFSQNIQTSGKEFGAAIRKAAGVPSLGEKIARPLTSVWQALEKATTASDAATRIEIYKRTLAETGSEAEAIFRALEVMNFNRKGSSAVIRILTAAVPFLNARMQGLDILYRAAIAPTVRGDTSERARQIQKTFFVRGAYLMALSAMYWLLTHDDEEYKKQEQETRDNYWLLPSLGVKIPIPFEVGVLFKVIPERILAYTLGDDTGRDFLQSMKRQLLNTLAFNPIPQTVLPVVETVTNFSFFTWRPIIPQGLENVAPEYQVGPGTSKLAEGIGKTLNLSPMRIDQLINGYTGTMGMYAVDLMDAIYNTMTDSPKPSKRFEQMPVIRRFAVDPEARGTVTAYYDLKNAVDQVVRTENLLERTMDYENWGPYMQENMKLLASKDYVSDMDKTLKELREMKTMIRSSTMSADAKRDAITQIGQMENALTANIQQLKKMFRE